jgi:hypothetical protein
MQEVVKEEAAHLWLMRRVITLRAYTLTVGDNSQYVLLPFASTDKRP